MAKRLSVDEFCQRVDKAYDGRISVVRETYIDTHHKVTAYCNVHKIYFECESNTLRRRKCDCPECVKETRKNAGIKNAKPWNEVHKSFIDKYGNKFSYDESSYKGTKQLMKVRCNDCGEEFESNAKATKTCRCNYCQNVRNRQYAQNRVRKFRDNKQM